MLISVAIVAEIRVLAATRRAVAIRRGNVGRIHTGVLVRETAEAIYLRTSQRAEIRIARAEVDELAPSSVSVMPQGLDGQLSRDELRDLLAFLASRGTFK